jgi:hypothetical protein
MGHKSISTTQRYISASEEVDPDGADILDQLLTAPRSRRGSQLSIVQAPPSTQPQPGNASVS